MFVSAMQQHTSVIIIHMSPPLEPSSPPPISPLQVITGHRAGLPVPYSNFLPAIQLHTVMWVCRCFFLCLSHSFLPLLGPQVRSQYLQLHSFPEDRFQKTGINEPICKIGIEAWTQTTDLWTQWGKERGGQAEKEVLTYIYYCCCC